MPTPSRRAAAAALLAVVTTLAVAPAAAAEPTTPPTPDCGPFSGAVADPDQYPDPLGTPAPVDPGMRSDPPINPPERCQ